jgi:hypothetical protein
MADASGPDEHASRDADEGAASLVVLLADGEELTLASLGPGVRVDLLTVDALLRLRLVVSRLGWALQLREVDEDLRGLLDLLGLSGCLGLGE